MKAPAVKVRMYDVGFGDCFLLSFDYGRLARHILIDCGTTARNASQERSRLLPVARDIATVCGGRLDAVVITHRHRDHVGGFARLKNAEAPGNVLAALSPRLVLQPWTEDPALEEHPSPARREFYKSLTEADRVAAEIFREQSRQFAKTRPAQFASLAWRTFANRAAIDGVRSLTGRHRYLHRGQKTGLEQLLPGFRVLVLGPAPPEDEASWSVLERNSARERWRALGGGSTTKLFALRAGKPLFPTARTWSPGLFPPPARWFLERIQDMREDQMLSFVRAVNSDINNTSLVLAIDGFGHRMLFPGDAESDSWRQMLADPRLREFLSGTTLYKASHHGSGNGTPRSVWQLLARRRPKAQPLVTLLSTRSGIYGSEEKRSEVPRTDLVEAFEARSLLLDTRKATGRAKGGVRYVQFDLRRPGEQDGPDMLKQAA